MCISVYIKFASIVFIYICSWWWLRGLYPDPTRYIWCATQWNLWKHIWQCHRLVQEKFIYRSTHSICILSVRMRAVHEHRCGQEWCVLCLFNHIYERLCDGNALLTLAVHPHIDLRLLPVLGAIVSHVSGMWYASSSNHIPKLGPMFVVSGGDYNRWHTPASVQRWCQGTQSLMEQRVLPMHCKWSCYPHSV